MNYINLFPVYQHTQPKVYNDYPKEIKDKAEFMWNHIKLVWCSNKKEQFEYVHNWIVCFDAGIKLQTALYLKSGQGTGNTMPQEFIINNVIGSKVVLQTHRVEAIIGRFNEGLIGKV